MHSGILGGDIAKFQYGFVLLNLYLKNIPTWEMFRAVFFINSWSVYD